MTNEEALALARLAWPDVPDIRVDVDGRSVWDEGIGEMLSDCSDQARFEEALRVLAGLPRHFTAQEEQLIDAELTRRLLEHHRARLAGEDSPWDTPEDREKRRLMAMPEAERAAELEKAAATRAQWAVADAEAQREWDAKQAAGRSAAVTVKLTQSDEARAQMMDAIRAASPYAGQPDPTIEEIERTWTRAALGYADACADASKHGIRHVGWLVGEVRRLQSKVADLEAHIDGEEERHRYSDFGEDA